MSAFHDYMAELMVLDDCIASFRVRTSCLVSLNFYYFIFKALKSTWIYLGSAKVFEMYLTNVFVVILVLLIYFHIDSGVVYLINETVSVIT